MENMNRRNLLKTVVTTAGVLGSTTIASKALANACGITPSQPEGPFFPENDQLDKNTDLVKVEGRRAIATGEIVFLTGVVTDQQCKPIKGAIVEIWQACATGKYNHSGDPNTAKLDPNFQYWGRAQTNAKGEYTFRTITPGAYPAGNGWIRPPHIHVKVHLRGYEELTTQLYWKGNSLNKKDLLLQRLSLAEQKRVIVDFKEEGQKKIGKFDITLNLIN